jgi:hypothetical protein
MSHQTGRDREIAEIVKYLWAAQVGRVFLGDADGEMTPVYPEMIQKWPRWKIKAERERIRNYLRGEVKKFANNNFPNLKPLKLAELYEPLLLFRNHKMSLDDFEKFVGGTREGLFRGAPLHSTVIISACWGLQTEFPEQHLIKDLAVLYNDLQELEQKLEQRRELTCSEMKDTPIRADIAEASRRANTYRRMCLLACFNLIEAYVNGLAWEYAQRHDISSLSGAKQRMIQEADGSIIKRIINIPEIISGKPTPFDATTAPLRDFVDTIKPYRDAIVHASPFAAPEKFGGYSKLQKIYDLNSKTVNHAIDVSQQIIGTIHQTIGGMSELPSWFLDRDEDGRFQF